MTACGVDLVLNAEVSGTTSTHIGSARILTGSNTVASFRVMFGPTTTPATASLQVKRFSNGANILTISTSNIGLRDVSGSQAAVSSLGLVNDWYDFYASGTVADSSVLIKGIKVTLQ
mgnify:CR=1 FL=1|jgi:hypothetical protein